MRKNKISVDQARKLWVKALRSGKYKRGTMYLRRNKNKYCCLGVLCDIYQKNFDTKLKWHENKFTSIISFGHAQSYTPGEVSNFLGLRERGQEKLANLNDSGKTFNQIADYIEANKNELFKSPKSCS